MKNQKRGMYRKAVFIVIYIKENNKILYLLLRRKLHWKGWEFPKGGLKNKESILKAVKREIKEETGQLSYNIKKYKISGKYKYDKLYPDRKGIIGQTYSLYSAKIKSKKIKLDKIEHFSYKWLVFNKAYKLLTWNNQKKCLKVVDKRLK